MRVLVTGGAGFIGSHLCDHLITAGHQVTAVDDFSLGRRQNIDHLSDSPAFTLHHLSVLDPGFDPVMQEGQFDAVFHLAANSDIQAGSCDRRVDLDKTFLTTWHVLEAMARHGVHQMLFASTSAVFGETDGPTGEDYGPLVPISFYGAAKLAGEAYCAAYAHRHEIKTWVFRFPNVVGSRATHGVILDFVRKLQQTPDLLEVLGDGTQHKPYLYVHDLIAAILLAWKSVDPAPYEVFNVAPDSATRVRAIAECVVRNMRPAARISYGTEPIGWPGDVPTFTYDTTKIRGLGWKPAGSSDAAMERAVADIIAEETGA